MACLLFLFPSRNPGFYYCYYFITVTVLHLNLVYMPRCGLSAEEIDFSHHGQEHRKCFPWPHATLVFTFLLLPELRRALSSPPKCCSHHTGTSRGKTVISHKGLQCSSRRWISEGYRNKGKAKGSDSPVDYQPGIQIEWS